MPRYLFLLLLFLVLYLISDCSRKTAVEKEEEKDDRFVDVPEANPDPEKMPDDDADGKDQTPPANTINPDLPEDEPDTLRYHDYVYRANIKTVNLHPEELPLSYPVIPLNGPTDLKLSFDDLEGGVKTFHYKLILCDADWQPAGLGEFDYLEGLNEGRIDNYDNSSNTLTSYTHYSLRFPNEDLRPTKAGNYLLKVYKNSNEDSLVLTKRFHLTENRIKIKGDVKKPNVPQKRKSHQQVEFEIQHENFAINNAFEEIKVVVQQNGRWDNARTGLQPKFVKDKTLKYNYQNKLLFQGLKEFRVFDTRNLRQMGRGVRKIDNKDRIPHVYLQPDKSRSYKQYRFYKEVNGNYVIGSENRKNPSNQADYAQTYFELRFNNVIQDGSIYLIGEFTDWQLRERYRLQWDYDEKVYKTSLFLKQGFYNYLYVVKNQGIDKLDFSTFEGSNQETENKYRIFVYHRPTGARYDRLIKVKTLKSK